MILIRPINMKHDNCELYKEPVHKLIFKLSYLKLFSNYDNTKYI